MPENKNLDISTTRTERALIAYTNLTPDERFALMQKVGPAYRTNRLGMKVLNLARTHRKMIDCLMAGIPNA